MSCENVLYKLGRSGGLISISTISRMCGRKGRFLIVADDLKSWFTGDRKNPFIDTDCGNYLKITSCGNDTFNVRITWLNNSSVGRTSGFNQDFTVQWADIHILLYIQEVHPISQLHVNHSDRQAKIRLYHTCKIPTDKHGRRAFSKAMRDNFQYGRDDVVILYPDGDNSYYFQNYSGGDRMLAGGLVAHSGIYRALNGREYPKVTYSVHT